MNELKNCINIEELKKLYRKLCFIHHPDKGGNVEDMKTLNNLYTELFDKLKNNLDTDSYEYKTVSKECPIEFIDAIMQIMHIENLEIEISGYWIWLDTAKITKTEYEYLYNIGFRWSKGKKLMYKDTSRTLTDIIENWKKPKYKQKSMTEIHNTYGYTKIDKESVKKHML